MTDDVLTRAKAPLDPDARMQAYYYGFDNTGLAVIDAVLSAVAIAGKAYHHTEDWGDGWNDYDSGENCHQNRIQRAAQKSADTIRDLIALAESQAKQLADIREFAEQHCPRGQLYGILAILDGNQQ